MDESPAKMYALTSVMLVLAVVPVALRFYVRTTRQKQGLSIDDWLIVPALIGLIGTAACTYDATLRGGLGGHTGLRPNGRPIFTESTEIYLKANFATLLTQMVSSGCTKLSVLFFYRRLFSGKAVFNVASWIMVVVVTMWTLGFFFAQLYQCVPIEANWLGPAARDAVCVDEIRLYLIGAWSDMILDIIILALPLPIIWSLQMTAARRFALMGVFLLGALTVLSSIARLVVYYHIADALLAGERDMAWVLAPTFYWPVVESALGIVGACLPVLRPLFNAVSPESVVRSLRNTVTFDSSRGSRTSPSRVSAGTPITAEKRQWIGSPQPLAQAFANRRPTADDTWSFHSDAESFGYYAEVSAKGIAVKRYADTREMV